MAKKTDASRTHRKAISSLDANSLRNMLREANIDDKAESLKRLLETLKPALLELIRNKGWSSRKTAQFFKERNIKARACDIDAFIKANPFSERDAAALRALKLDLEVKPETGGCPK